MIEISVWKILVVLVVALIVLGPERLIKVAHKTGRLLGQLKSTLNSVQKELKAIESDSKVKDPANNNQQE